MDLPKARPDAPSPGSAAGKSGPAEGGKVPTQADFVLLLASRLQPLPETVDRLAALDPTACDIADVSEAIRSDPAFSSRLLLTANSPFSASATRVNSPDEAIMRLGIGLLLSMSHALVSKRQ